MILFTKFWILKNWKIMKNCKKRGTFDFLNPRFTTLYHTKGGFLLERFFLGPKNPPIIGLPLLTLFESIDGRLHQPNIHRVVPIWFWNIPPGLMSVGMNNEICVSCTGRQLSSLNLKRIWNHYPTIGAFFVKLTSFLVPTQYLF